MSILVLATTADAARVRVRQSPAVRTRATVRTGFPIRRTLPHVVARPAPVVCVAPRVYLASFVRLALRAVGLGGKALEVETGLVFGRPLRVAP